MKIAIFLGHPAHFHLFKFIATKLIEDGHKVDFVIKKKDVLTDLLDNEGFHYYTIRADERKTTTAIGLIWSLLSMDFKMFKYLIKHKPTLLIGTYVALFSKLTQVPIISVNEDDANVVPYFALTSYPLSDAILNPNVCNSGRWDNKAIKYEGYQKLAYLHPDYFFPEKSIVKKYFDPEQPYFILRFSKLNAHHDAGINGISKEISLKLIEILNKHGKVIISSERELEPELEPYRVHFNSSDMHHIMAYAQLFIGDSQSMCAESGLLGVPFIRINDFVGRIGYLNEIENKYKLGYGCKTNETDKIYNTLEKLLLMTDRVELFQKRRLILLEDKIDVVAFFTWFIENYPESKKIMKNNPNYQYEFR